MGEEIPRAKPEDEVSLSEAFKHLIKYADLDTSGLIRWRFASDPRFPYWCLNIKQRHQLLGQAKIYIQQHPHDAHLTVEQLRAMVGTLSTDQLMKRVHRYAAKVSGTDQYWFQRYLELKSLLEQKGIPTCFWTVSSADTYWPQLHSLMPHSQTDYLPLCTNTGRGRHPTLDRLVLLQQAERLCQPLASTSSGRPVLLVSY